jgi:hypothetical protein
MTPTECAAALTAAVDHAAALFDTIGDAESLQRVRADGWSIRQIVGHLIDSACNNHRRFVLGQSANLVKFDGYEQDDWVTRQHYDTAAWPALVALWIAYNRHLVHVMASTPDSAMSRAALAPDGQSSVTLGFLIEDYVRHLRHHVEQIGRVGE